MKLAGGVWDILMVVGAKKEIENKFQGLIVGDFIKKTPCGWYIYRTRR